MPKKKKIVFVCMGNTCRSPMAEKLFDDLLLRRGVTDYEVSSAGLAAMDGDGAMPCACEVLAEMGLSLTAHRSRKCCVAELQEAALVVTMTEHQREVLLPCLEEDKLVCLGSFGGGDIGDPYGNGIIIYRKCRDQIAAALDKLWDFLQTGSIGQGQNKRERGLRNDG